MGVLQRFHFRGFFKKEPLLIRSSVYKKITFAAITVSPNIKIDIVGLLGYEPMMDIEQEDGARLLVVSNEGIKKLEGLEEIQIVDNIEQANIWNELKGHFRTYISYHTSIAETLSIGRRLMSKAPNTIAKQLGYDLFEVLHNYPNASTSSIAAQLTLLSVYNLYLKYSKANYEHGNSLKLEMEILIRTVREDIQHIAINSLGYPFQY